LHKNANWPADKVERWPVSKLVPNARNARTHSDEQVTQLAASIEEWGWTIPVLVDEAGGIIAGHSRVMAAHRLGLEDVPVMVAADRLAIEIAELRASDFDISLIGFSESEIDDLLKVDEGAGAGSGALAERFMIPPFSVLSARGGWWQERKAAWLALGIQSELGRGENSAPGGSPRPLDRAKAARAEPGGSKMPAADYRKTHARGDGRGRSIDPQG
jgi:hypothetical protein